MIRRVRYSLAAGLIASPIGWIGAGVLEALGRPNTTLLHRPLYEPGNYLGEALGAALLAAVVVGLLVDGATQKPQA